MLLKYFYDEKLAHASYVVGCQATGEAIVIDPARDVKPYLELAQKEGVRIVGATETHIHADFISGARELAARTGATLYLSDEGGEGWRYEFLEEYPSEKLKDGSQFNIGNIRFEVMHTPGHTPEHISFLVTDGGSKATAPLAIFTGDFVFVGDVGRPDLLEKAAGQKGTSDALARKMFQSLQRFKTLPDFIQVLPAHGAGSACGKALGAVPSSTVGYEKMVNWALQYDNEEDFVQALLTGQPEAPKYFAMMKKLNKEGPPLLSDINEPKIESTDGHKVNDWLEKGVVIDTRPSKLFAERHFPGTLNIPFNKSFVNWAGWLISYDVPIYLLASEKQLPEVLESLQSIGLDHVVAAMDPKVIHESGLNMESYENVDPKLAKSRVLSGEVQVLDVRNLNEWDEGHMSEAKHIMLGHLDERLHELSSDKPILVHCKSGGRSAIAASILQAKGIKNVQNLLGGYDEWVRTN
ncbi:MBL fold metallo-hydrolase [Alicyclobacillus tolerans]|uniref:Hydroxyacylglutathione hydrolase n=1 Tax=Alicyclobacillus tolerans TaxID=90970 RepID=A0ABT9LV65_9BACL|nr:MULTISPECIES: MBL fold metallo-hydrolase [Alicyclobacillus]MDP9728128.1 hydroxyacylglutathione hydrolase [Alicyclobacillus tengchongensis]QRF23354.1 MBL fold metallo-hydrolase [Alicyclobacillus sp. TC]